jgi:hypothetical protein
MASTRENDVCGVIGADDVAVTGSAPASESGYDTPDAYERALSGAASKVMGASGFDGKCRAGGSGTLPDADVFCVNIIMFVVVVVVCESIIQRCTVGALTQLTAG